MPLAYLGVIGGFLKGLLMGLAVVVAGVFVIAILSDGDRPTPAPMAAAPTAPDAAKIAANGATPNLVAPAPPMPQLAQIAPDAPDQMQLGATAPVSRLNTDALAALARAGGGDQALSGALASAPRPSSAGSGLLTPAGSLDATDPGPIYDDQSGAPLRRAPSRMAALDTDIGRAGYGGSGGQALAAVSGVTLPRPFDGGAAAEAGFAAPTPGAQLMAPAAAGMAPSPGSAPSVPGARLAALTPPGGAAMTAPTFGGTASGLSAPRMAAPGLPSPSRTPGGFGDDTAGLGARMPMTSSPGGRPTPGMHGGAPLIAPGQRAPEAASPAPPQRVVSLSPSMGETAPIAGISSSASLPGFGMMPRMTDADGPVGTAADAAAHRAMLAPVAPVQAAPEADMAALRALIVSQTGGVPLPFARPSRAEAPAGTPVERLDLAAASGNAPVQRTGFAATQPGLSARDRAVSTTPVTRLDARAPAAPNAAAVAVLGPGRLDDRRASSLVAAISTRPGSGINAPRIVAAPGLSQDPGGRNVAGASAYSSQRSAPRPTFGAAAPTLGGAGAQLTEDAPLVMASRGGGVVASRGSDAPLLARPRIGMLPSVGAPARAQPFASPSADLAPAAEAEAPLVEMPSATIPDGPLLALVLHGIDPAQAVDPAGPLAPLLAAKAPITLVTPLAYLTDPTLGARLRAMGVDLIVEADPRDDLSAIAALGAVAVLPVSSDGRPISMSQVRRFLSGMRNKGLALFNPAPGGGATARMALNMGLQVVNSQQRVEIRSEANMAALRSSLDRAAFDARKDGSAAVELWATPAAIAEAADWFATAGTRTASPATVSALLQAR